MSQLAQVLIYHKLDILRFVLCIVDIFDVECREDCALVLVWSTDASRPIATRVWVLSYRSVDTYRASSTVCHWWAGVRAQTPPEALGKSMLGPYVQPTAGASLVSSVQYSYSSTT